MGSSGQFLYRDEPATLEAIKRQAALRGRSLAEEMRLATRIHLHEHMLAQLRDPKGRAEAIAEGHDVEADEGVLKKQLASLRKTAFAKPLSPNLRGSLLADDERE